MDKIALAFKSLFRRSGRHLLRRTLMDRLAVPLFTLQSSLRSSYIPGPTMFIIEPTNRCNLNCAMCIRRFWDPAINPFGDMTFEFFEKYILKYLKPYHLVNLQCDGEPLLNPDFLKMLAACKKVGCMTTFTTNGLVLRKDAAAIVALGADEVCVSVDGLEAMKTWRHVDVERVLDGIDAINEARQTQGRKVPMVIVTCILTRDNLPELPQLIELLGRKGVARVTLVHLVAYESVQREQSVIPVYDEAVQIFEAAKIIARNYGIQLLLPPAPGSAFKCFHPFRSLLINWNGDVRPCCISTINETGSFLVGNVAKNSLPSLWNSSYMHKFRRTLSREENLPAMCQNCPMRRCDMEAYTHLLTPDDLPQGKSRGKAA